MPLRAGELDHLAGCRAPVESLDAGRAPQITYPVETAARRCSVKQLSGGEFNEADQTKGQSTLELTMGRVPNMNPSWRVHLTSRSENLTRVLELLEVEHVEDHYGQVTIARGRVINPGA